MRSYNADRLQCNILPIREIFDSVKSIENDRCINFDENIVEGMKKYLIEMFKDVEIKKPRDKNAIMSYKSYNGVVYFSNGLVFCGNETFYRYNVKKPVSNICGAVILPSWQDMDPLLADEENEKDSSGYTIFASDITRMNRDNIYKSMSSVLSTMFSQNTSYIMDANFIVNSKNIVLKKDVVHRIIYNYFELLNRNSGIYKNLPYLLSYKKGESDEKVTYAATTAADNLFSLISSMPHVFSSDENSIRIIQIKDSFYDKLIETLADFVVEFSQSDYSLYKLNNRVLNYSGHYRLTYRKDLIFNTSFIKQDMISIKDSGDDYCFKVDDKNPDFYYPLGSYYNSIQLIKGYSTDDRIEYAKKLFYTIRRAAEDNSEFHHNMISLGILAPLSKEDLCKRKKVIADRRTKLKKAIFQKIKEKEAK